MFRSSTFAGLCSAQGLPVAHPCLSYGTHGAHGHVQGTNSFLALNVFLCPPSPVSSLFSVLRAISRRPPVNFKCSENKSQRAGVAFSRSAQHKPGVVLGGNKRTQCVVLFRCLDPQLYNSVHFSHQACNSASEWVFHCFFSTCAL